ncbi:9382_t:CDS:2, partial [Cetraspora pellucida]
LGWNYKGHSKNIYYDGHERDDVVRYWQQFLEQIANLRPRMAVYEEDDINQVILPKLLPNVPEIVTVTYDESIFYANDGVKKFWEPLCLSQEEKEANDLLPNNEHIPYTDACIIVYLNVVKQVSKKAILIFERTHSGKVALFMFDNSCNHNSFAEDALLVSQINIKDGEKRPLLHNGRMHNERGLWMLGLTRECNGCKADASTNLQYCATNILKSQPDFASQKNYLQEIIEVAGHLCLKKTIPHALESVSLTKICHFACQSGRYMSAYKHGLSGKAAVFAVKKYQSHHRVPK